MSKPANRIFNRPVAVGTLDPAAASGQAVSAETDGPERTDFPCSIAQERFWLLDRLDPGNASYNVAVRWRLEGRMSSELLELAWRTIIERHEILRTVFLEVDGAPLQRIMALSPFKMAEIDLSALPADQQSSEADRIGVIEARTPFDVETGPLIRATLLRFSSTLSVILVTTHQIVSDGWSVGVMAREMGVIYEALRHDEPAPLDPLTIQYADYSQWQLEWLRVRGTAAETEYWTRQLAGVKPFKVIPDRPRPAMPTTNGIIVSRVLPRELTDRAQALCAERGATLFAAALGALCAMLARYTRQDEIVLGTQVSDRNQVELETMIGQFVNSLILRNDLSGDPRFVEVIDRVRDTSAQALEYRHIPIERLLGMLKGEQGNSSAPLVSVNFIFQKTFIQNTTYSDFTLIDMPSLPAGAIYDLNFFMVERPDGWRFSLQYNTDQFERSTADRMLDYFQSVLESAVTGPQRRVSQLRLSTPDESSTLLARLNQSEATPVEGRTVVELFEAHVARVPKAIAVVHAGQSLTYEELNRFADRLANGLRARGTGLGSRVGICIDRSPELLGTILALMKIGASCLLLDPADPAGFLRGSAESTRVSAVAVRGTTRALWKGSGIVIIGVDEVLADRSSPKQLAAHPGITTQTGAYVGLVPRHTGVVQDVSLSHGTLASLLTDLGRRIQIDDRDVLVATSPIGLDVAIAELLLPLAWGARLVLASPKDMESPRGLTHLLKRCNATALHALSTTWMALQQYGWAGPAGFKMLCSRGMLSGPVAHHLLQHGAELWTLYDSAETGIWAALNRVQSRLDAPLVGKPIGGWSVAVVDPKNQLTDVGSTGELLLSHAARAGARKTGDLARLREGGQIEWLGRSDRRFLHRGYVIDPAEIEAILKRDARVADVMVAEGQQAFDGEVVACVATSDPRSSPQALTESLHADLVRLFPTAMIPIVVIAADGALPLEHGALNWRKLRPAGASARAADAPTGPLQGVEEGIAAIWRPLLEMQDIDPTANFFELGGHSLLAARMLARVNGVFNRRVTLNTLFRAPSIRELARVIDQKDSREFDFRQMVKLQPHGSRPPLIAINNTGTYYSLAKCLGPDQPVISLQLFDPSVKTDAIPQTLEEVAAGYVQLIQRVQPNGPYNLMGWCVAGGLSFEVARQLTNANKEVSNLYLMDCWLPRYIERQPALRRFISGYSLRWQLLKADWRMVPGGRSFASFLGNRNAVKALRDQWRRLLSKAPPATGASTQDEFSREDYDRWLLNYLKSITSKYEPGHFPGKLTLFRSLQEPTGWFFDPLAGWGRYADSVKLVMVAGNHYTMFQETGARQMAEQITQQMAES